VLREIFLEDQLYRNIIILFLLAVMNTCDASSQLKDENFLLKWSSWALIQAIPSPTFFEDRNETNSALKFGLEWQVIPVSYSFSHNKYVSPLSFFHIKPVKRFSGSAEVFYEPSLITGNYKYSMLKKFSSKLGARFIIPVAQRGEYLALSFGAGYYQQNRITGEKIEGVTYEAGVYSVFGMLGLKFNYNQNADSRYNIGLYIKYY